jgi:hypothetical protein
VRVHRTENWSVFRRVSGDRSRPLESSPPRQLRTNTGARPGSLRCSIRRATPCWWRAALLWGAGLRPARSALRREPQALSDVDLVQIVEAIRLRNGPGGRAVLGADAVQVSPALTTYTLPDAGGATVPVGIHQALPHVNMIGIKNCCWRGPGPTVYPHDGRYCQGSPVAQYARSLRWYGCACTTAMLNNTRLPAGTHHKFLHCHPPNASSNHLNGCVGLCRDGPLPL